ncbi:MAG TPA: thioredoxin domain-containing protein [Terracidiphilus sp.]|nr:thioredoxin domain-containing protein [Terracidiphilus sp.]
MHGNELSASGSNQLEQAASSYLRSARHQPVRWHAWGAQAFERAQAEGKPILLDIGAVWCHWCHVMDRESYEDPEMARLINEHFVAIKVDRDERPDVDARYQAAVSAISGQGGWPLTAFLTPDGRPYFGGTYFPRDDRFGRPGFGRVLLTMADVWRDRREEALESAASVMAVIEQNENYSAHSDDLNPSLVDKIAASALASFDAHNGGFGSQPKFPHPGVLDLLLHLANARGNEGAREAFAVTLEKMAQGGVYDQLAGGFHRYSVDEKWVVPHFEKMLYDNTELLRNYVHGYQSLGRQDFRQTALEIVAWLSGEMANHERGGFFASQDADVSLDDDGDYFTWTLDEARAVLEPAELELAVLYWDIGELGDMHHNPAKNVLHRKYPFSVLAADSGRKEEDVRQLIQSARAKLLAARNQRQAPFIDRTLYTGWNAMAVTAFLEAARVFAMEEPRELALRTLTRLLAEAWDGDESLFHVICYGEEEGNAGDARKRVPATLDDYAFTIHACVDAWTSSGEMSFYRAAVKLAGAMLARFFDRTSGAFYDTAAQAGEAVALGALSARRKPLQDSPTPAGNPTAASALLRLQTLSGRKEFGEAAEETLASFAGMASQLGLYAGSYGLALERFLRDPVQVLVLGSGAEADAMERAALEGYAVNKTVLRVDAERLRKKDLPEELAETVGQISIPDDAAAWALVCTGRTCMPPVRSAQALHSALRG